MGKAPKRNREKWNKYQREYRAQNRALWNRRWKEYWSTASEEIKARKAQRALTHRTKNQLIINEAKTGRPCMDCGGKFMPCAMDFDHVSGKGDVG